MRLFLVQCIFIVLVKWADKSKLLYVVNSIHSIIARVDPNTGLINYREAEFIALILQLKLKYLSQQTLPGCTFHHYHVVLLCNWEVYYCNLLGQ